MLKYYILLFVLLVACSKSEKVDEEVVNVYTHRHYDTDEELYKVFTKETGIKVNLVKATADELIARLENEGANSTADVLITVDAARLYLAKEKELLQKIDSKILNNNIPAQYRDIAGYWFGITKRARAIAASVERVPYGSLSTYEELGLPAYKGKVLVRSSNHIYNQSLLAGFITHDETGVFAEQWAKTIVNNFAREPKGNDRDQMKGIAGGQGDVAIVNTYYYCKLLESDDPQEQLAAASVYIIYPNQDTYGTHVNISGAGITKNSPNKENAIKFLEFLSSEMAQKFITDQNHEYPINPNVEPSDLLKQLGEFKEDSIDFNLLGKYNRQALMIYDKVGWK